MPGDGWGTRIQINRGHVYCDAQHHFTAGKDGNGYTTPDVCNPNQTGQCRTGEGGIGGGGPGGANILQDEWGPAIALAAGASANTPKMLLTWYSTTDDTNGQFVNMYMTENDTGDGNNGGWGTPQIISFATSGTSEIVPWDHTLADWSDYQAIGVDFVGRNFLAVWGGDARNSDAGGANLQGQSAIWSSAIR